MMLQYDQYRGGVPSRSSKAEQSENHEGERRTPIRPRESMKDIIYNGVGEENAKGGSRVVAFLFSVIILTTRPIVIIIIKEGEIEIFITSFTLSLMPSPYPEGRRLSVYGSAQGLLESYLSSIKRGCGWSWSSDRFSWWLNKILFGKLLINCSDVVSFTKICGLVGVK